MSIVAAWVWWLFKALFERIEWSTNKRRSWPGKSWTCWSSTRRICSPVLALFTYSKSRHCLTKWLHTFVILPWTWSSVSSLPLVWMSSVQLSIRSHNPNVCNLVAHKVMSSRCIVATWAWRTIWWSRVVMFRLELQFSLWFLAHCDVSATFSKCQLIADVVTWCLVLFFSDS